MNWKKYLALTASLCAAGIITQKVVEACGGDYDPEGAYFSFFQNNLTNDDSYRPFYYTSFYKYYTDYDYYYGDNRDTTDANVAEWKVRMGGNMRDKDVYQFVYGYPHSQLSNLYYHLEKQQPLTIPDSVKRNGMTQWFIQKQDLEMLGYIMYAKKCEPHVIAGDYDPWDVQSIRRDVPAMNKLMKSGQQLFAAAKNDWVKLRYAYQVLRLSHYSGQYQRTVQLYDSLVKPLQAVPGIMQDRCLALAAGAERKVDQPYQAAIGFATVFDRSYELRQMAELNYSWIEKADRNQLLRACPDNHLRSVVWTLEGLGQPEYDTECLEQAWKNDPTAKVLPLLLTREINKLEEGYYSQKLLQERGFAGGWNYFYFLSAPDQNQRESLEKEQRHLQKLTVLAENIAKDKKVTEPAYWSTGAAYLNLLQDKTKQADKLLAKAEKQNPSAAIQQQIGLIQLLSAIRSAKTIDAGMEQKMYKAFTLMETRFPKSTETARSFCDALNTMVATRYLRQGDTTKAVLCYNKAETASSNRYSEGAAPSTPKKIEELSGYYWDMSGMVLNEMMSISGIQRMKTFLAKPSKNDFEKWLLKSNVYDADMLNELEGTKNLRMLDFAAAQQALSASGKWRDAVYVNPFVARLRDQQESEDQDGENMLSKEAYAKRMAELQKNLQSKDNGFAKAAFEYANGLYNISYYGKSWDMLFYDRGSSDGMAYYEDTTKLSATQEVYYRCRQAEQYFMEAFNNSTDKNFKAQCLFMAAKCWQKRAKDTNLSLPKSMTDNYDSYVLYSLINPYFKQLQEYQKTSFYTEVYGSCGYLQLYVKKAKYFGK
jgi:hypothetical protein